MSIIIPIDTLNFADNERIMELLNKQVTGDGK